MRTSALAVLFALLLCATTQAQTGRQTSGTISGRVHDGDSAVVDATVFAVAVNAMSNAPAGRARTGADGRYTMKGLPPGSYRVGAVAPGLYSDDDRPQFDGAAVTIGEGGDRVDGVDFSLRPGGVITGRVTDADGRPVVDATVSVERVDGAYQTSLPVQSFVDPRTDDRGVYRIYGLAPGVYVVSVSPLSPGRARETLATPYLLTFHPHEADSAGAGRVEVAAGRVVDDVDISAIPFGRTYAAKGHAVDAEGKPVPGVTVWAEPQGRDGSPPGTGARAVANEKGEFTIEELHSGRHTLGVAIKDGENRYSTPIDFEVADADVAGLEIRVNHASTLSGVVVVDGTDAAPANARQILISTMGSGSAGGNTRANEDGSFRLAGLQPGSVEFSLFRIGDPTVTLVRVEVPGRGSVSSVDLGPDDEVTDVRLVVVTPTGKVRGTVRIDGPAPPISTQLNVYLNQLADDGARKQTYWSRIDPRGQFLIENVLPGNYQATVITSVYDPQSPKRYESDVVTLTVPATGAAELDLTARPVAPNETLR